MLPIQGSRNLRHADDLHHLRAARAALGARRRRPRRSVSRSDVEACGAPGYGASMPSFGEIVERSLALLQRRGRVSHTALRLEFGLDDAETPPLEALDADARAVVGARFHAICGEVAGRLGGHVLPWVSDGDAIFFGHPRAQDDDALRAVRCGWEILRTLEAAREVVEREFGVRLEARLAIATGVTGEGAEPFGDIPRSAGAVQERGATDRLTVDDATRTQAGATFGFEACGGDLFA